MTLIKALVHWIHRAIEPQFFVVSFSIMEPETRSSLPPAMANFVTYDGMLSFSIIIIHENKLWGSEGVARVIIGYP